MNRENMLHSFTAGTYHVEDLFWTPKMEMVRTKMIPYQWKALNDQVEDAAPSYCIRNFRIAAGLEQGTFQGCVFQDSDVAKWLEAVGYSLSWKKDAELEKTADQVIELIGKTQQPDGYLDTYYIINGLEKRWTNLADNHELYCAGHMIEAGIGYYEGTGKRTLLDIVIRLADCVDRTFGREEGKIHGYPGHEIIEMALVRLYHVTGEKRYLRLAEYFINERGRKPLYFQEERKRNGNLFYWENSLFQYQYYQAGKPVREQNTAEGHAVRAVYLYSGMTDVARETGDTTLQDAVDVLWKDVTRRQMYITGAIGSSEYGESFTFDYDLPNDEIYGETCASIGLVFWARRMLETRLDSEFADVMERALYNGCISGASIDGTKFFYVNPLEVDPNACKKDQRKKHVETQRQKWFSCACCPPNLARLLTSLGAYICAFGEGILAFHLYIGGEVAVPGGKMRISVKSCLPWNNDVKMCIAGEMDDYTLAFRIPGWSKNFRVLVNGGAVSGESRDGYFYLHRNWKNHDVVELLFDMPIERNYANPKVKADLGKTAVSRGPLIYCMEEIDNGGGLSRYYIPGKSSLELSDGKMEAGEKDICGLGYQLSAQDWEDKLYRFERPVDYMERQLRFIPYYLWNNRAEGEMCVWINEMCR